MKKHTEKISKAKIVALIISSILHAVAIYYLGSLALDYVAPEGTVDSMEMTYDINKGIQTETTEISVTDSVEQAPTVAPTPTMSAAPKVEAPTPPPSNLLPTKQATSESEVENTQEQSPVVVAPPLQEIQKEDIPEDLLKDTYSQDKTKDVPANDPLPETATQLEENLPPVPATVTTDVAVPAKLESPEQTAQSYGRPDCIKSDKVLSPIVGNKAINYPTMARLRKIEGTAVFHYTVSAEGLVTEVKVAQSSGSTLLDTSAMDSIKTWKFKPTGEEGVYERPIRFKLSGDSKEAPAQLRRTN